MFGQNILSFILANIYSRLTYCENRNPGHYSQPGWLYINVNYNYICYSDNL